MLWVKHQTPTESSAPFILFRRAGDIQDRILSPNSPPLALPWPMGNVQEGSPWLLVAGGDPRVAQAGLSHGADSRGAVPFLCLLRRAISLTASTAQQGPAPALSLPAAQRGPSAREGVAAVPHEPPALLGQGSQHQPQPLEISTCKVHSSTHLRVRGASVCGPGCSAPHPQTGIWRPPQWSQRDTTPLLTPSPALPAALMGRCGGSSSPPWLSGAEQPGAIPPLTINSASPQGPDPTALCYVGMTSSALPTAPGTGRGVQLLPIDSPLCSVSGTRAEHGGNVGTGEQQHGAVPILCRTDHSGVAPLGRHTGRAWR